MNSFILLSTIIFPILSVKDIRSIKLLIKIKVYVVWFAGLITLSEENVWTSLVVQWLRLCISTAGGVGLIPGRGAKIPHAMQCGQKKRKKKMFW